MGVETEIANLRKSGHSTGAVQINRPANTTAYTGNDVVGGAIQFSGLSRAEGGDVFVTSAALELDISAVPSGMTSFNLYLYNVTPPSALADNAAFDISSGDRSALVCKISLGTPVDEGSTLRIETDQINKQITVPTGGVLFGYLVTVGGFTPAANSEVYSVTLHTTDA